MRTHRRGSLPAHNPLKTMHPITRQSPHRRSLDALQDAPHVHPYLIHGKLHLVATDRAKTGSTHRFFFTVTEGQLKGWAYPAEKWHRMERNGEVEMVEADSLRRKISEGTIRRGREVLRHG